MHMSTDKLVYSQKLKNPFIVSTAQLLFVSNFIFAKFLFILKLL